MDAVAITSAAQAVHQELVRKLAEQARINRLRDQLRRARPGGPVAWPGAAVRVPGSHADPRVHAQPDAGSWLSPCSFFFSPGPAATSSSPPDRRPRAARPVPVLTPPPA